MRRTGGNLQGPGRCADDLRGRRSTACEDYPSIFVCCALPGKGRKWPPTALLYRMATRGAGSIGRFAPNTLPCCLATRSAVPCPVQPPLPTSCRAAPPSSPHAPSRPCATPRPVIRHPPDCRAPDAEQQAARPDQRSEPVCAALGHHHGIAAVRRPRDALTDDRWPVAVHRADSLC